MLNNVSEASFNKKITFYTWKNVQENLSKTKPHVIEKENTTKKTRGTKQVTCREVEQGIQVPLAHP